MNLIENLNHPLFENFSQTEKEYLLKFASRTTFEDGAVLIREGDTNHEIYIIIEGKVAVTTERASPENTTHIATVTAGSIIGEIGVITNNPRSATVTAIEKTTALVIDVEAIKIDNGAKTIFDKLLKNLSIELSKKLIYSHDQLVKCDTDNQCQSRLDEDKSIYAPNSILLPLGWKWLDIMHEVPFLAEHGYDAIKIFPPQEFAVRPGNPWWAIYQPVSYNLSSFYGTEEDLIKMIDFCHSYNLRVYADLILNHMAAFIETEAEHVGTNGHKFSRYHYENLNSDNDSYKHDDFYHFDAKGNKQISDEDYCKLEGIWHLEHFDLLNLPKLNLDSPHVLSVLRKYVKYLLSLGIDGFRIDAAKHIKTSAIAKIFLGLKTNDGLSPFLYQEYYTGAPLGIDVYSFMKKYFKIGYATAFEYGKFLSDAINGKANTLQKLVEYSFGSSWLHYPENRAIAVIDNHDTERMMPNMLNYKCTQNNAYVLAYIFMLAWPFGIPKIMSSFRFVNHNDPIPESRVWQNGRNTCFDAGSPWVAQHRWNAIANMVLFRNKTKHAIGISHIWADDNKVAFARTYQKPKEYLTSVGFVVINATAQPLKHRFETGLPDGKYYDLISSHLVDGKMNGPKILVENYGFISVEIKPFDALVISIDFVE